MASPSSELAHVTALPVPVSFLGIVGIHDECHLRGVPYIFTPDSQPQREVNQTHYKTCCNHTSSPGGFLAASLCRKHGCHQVDSCVVQAVPTYNMV